MQQAGTPRRFRPAALAALLTAAVFLAVAALTGCSRSVEPDVLASVNGEPITKEELYQEMYAQVGQETLEMLITQRLILQEGRKKNVEISDAEINERLEGIIQQGFSSRDEFMGVLEAYNLELGEIEHQIRIQLVAEKLLAEQIDIDPDEARAYFESNRDRFGRPEQLKGRHILLGTRTEAENVRAALVDGADFAELAREKSRDFLTAESGGDLGIISRREDLPSWQAALFDLEEGSLSEVLEGPTGFHVVEVVEKHPAENPSFDEAEDQVYRVLLEQEMQLLYPSWVNGLRAKAEIEYKE